jgi:hypothetical protein
MGKSPPIFFRFDSTRLDSKHEHVPLTTLELDNMARTPEERREINRRNSLRSTGPRSAEGKARARLNALKHGLRAEEFALPGEDCDELKRLTDEWVDYYEPRSPGERAALDRCVYATVQLKRCARYHVEAVAEQVRQAQEDWDRQQEDEVAELVELLKTEPEKAVRNLKRSTLGCRWLIEEWTNLLRPLDEGQFWLPSELDKAIRLSGESPDPAQYRTSHMAYFLAYYAYFCRQHRSEETIAWLTDSKRMPDTFRRDLNGGGPPDDKASRGVLQMIVAEELAALRATEARLRSEVEGPRRASLVHRSWLLEGPRGALLARYERMHDTAYHRAYTTLMKGELQHEDELAPAPATPVVTPAHLEGTAAVLDITAAKSGAPNEAIATLTSGVAKVQKPAFPAPEGSVEAVGGSFSGVLTVAPGVAPADPPVARAS